MPDRRAATAQAAAPPAGTAAVPTASHLTPHASCLAPPPPPRARRYVPTAVLSRQTAGIRGRALVINLPGKPKSIRETFDEVFKSIPYCVQLLGGPYLETVPSVVEAFRPPAERRAGSGAAAAAAAAGGR